MSSAHSHNNIWYLNIYTLNFLLSCTNLKYLYSFISFKIFHYISFHRQFSCILSVLFNTVNTDNFINITLTDTVSIKIFCFEQRTIV